MSWISPCDLSHARVIFIVKGSFNGKQRKKSAHFGHAQDDKLRGVETKADSTQPNRT